MATKTLILRPTSVTCSDESLVTLYPSGTILSNAHLLVGEEVADDDATYITGGLSSNINYHFMFDKPNDLKNITKFSFMVRYKLEASSQNHTVTYKIYLNTDNYTLCTMTDNSTVYSDMNENITDDIKSSIVNTLNNGQNLNFYITQAITGNSAKSKPIRVTQIYIEITYESNEFVIQYLKQNNTWINIGELSIYYKRNYKWNPLNDVLLESYIDKKYLVEVIE